MSGRLADSQMLKLGGSGAQRAAGLLRQAVLLTSAVRFMLELPLTFFFIGVHRSARLRRAFTMVNYRQLATPCGEG